MLLIDIEMPDMNGIDVVKQIGGRAPLSTIFVTAYPEHAVDAFELHALDYLTKPVKPERAKRAMVEPSDPSNVTHREDGCGFTLDFYLAEAKTIYLARKACCKCSLEPEVILMLDRRTFLQNAAKSAALAAAAARGQPAPGANRCSPIRERQHSARVDRRRHPGPARHLLCRSGSWRQARRRC